MAYAVGSRHAGNAEAIQNSFRQANFLINLDAAARTHDPDIRAYLSECLANSAQLQGGIR